MSRHDIKIVDTGGRVNVPTYSWQVALNASVPSIKAGEPVLQAGQNSQYVALAADGEPEISVSQPIVGIAASDSTETASADGSVEIYMPLPGIVYEIAATSSAAADTQSEIDALCGDKFTLDLTSSKFTLDTATGAAASWAFLVVGGNPNKKTLKVMISSEATILGRAQV